MGVVAPHSVEIVVLSRNTKAFLGIHGTVVRTGLHAQENVFKLHHTGIGKEQGAVTAWNERSAGHDGVPPFSEEVEERLTNLVTG